MRKRAETAGPGGRELDELVRLETRLAAAQEQARQEAEAIVAAGEEAARALEESAAAALAVEIAGLREEGERRREARAQSLRASAAGRSAAFRTVSDERVAAVAAEVVDELVAGLLGLEVPR